MLSLFLLLLAVPSQPCKQLSETTLAALRQKDSAKASSILESAPAECTQSASFYELQGVAFDLSNKTEPAEQAFEKAVSIQPDEPRLLAELGAAYLKSKKLASAADVLGRAYRLDPSNSAVAKYLIAADAELNRWQDAARTFDSIGAGMKPNILSPPVMILWFARALIEANRAGEVESRLLADRATLTPPILFSLGEVFAQSNMYAQVIAFLTRIPDQEADDAVSFNLGLAYSHLQQFEDARRCYFQAIDRRPEHSDAYLHVGVDYASAGDARRAIPWMARAHHFAPDRPDIAYALTEQLLQLDYTKSAEQVAVEAAKVNPADPLLLVAEGDVKAARKELIAARGCFQQALTQHTGFVPALIGLSRVNISEGKEEAAQELLQQALSIDPDNPAANGTLGLLEVRQSNWEKAAAHLRTSWQKDRAREDVVLGLARAYRGTGRLGDALQVLESVAPGMQDSAGFHLQLSQIYSQLHRTDDAKREQNKLQTLQRNQEGALHFEKPQSYVF